MITFNGVRSDARYLVVQHYPKRVYPKRKYIKQTVPGRSGDLYISEGEDAFTNYEQKYDVFLDAKAPSLPQVTRGLADWLLRPTGYKRLEDSYDPDFYRMALYTGGEEFINIFNEYGIGTLTFDCQPKRFFKSGEQSIDLRSGQDYPVYAPTKFRCHPIYTVTCSASTSSSNNAIIAIHDGAGGTKNFTVKGAYGVLTIDCEAHTARRTVNGVTTNANSDVQDDYENLYFGDGYYVTWNQYVRSVSMVPRWWTL